MHGNKDGKNLMIKDGWTLAVLASQRYIVENMSDTSTTNTIDNTTDDQMSSSVGSYSRFFLNQLFRTD